MARTSTTLTIKQLVIVLVHPETTLSYKLLNTKINSVQAYYWMLHNYTAHYYLTKYISVCSML